MTSKPDDLELNAFSKVLGIDLPPKRLEQDLAAFADILSALRKLRELDLTDVHPVVVFDMAKVYGDEGDA